MDRIDCTKSVSVCSDCGEKIPFEFLSPTPEVKRYLAAQRDGKTESMGKDIDLNAMLCPSCMVKRYQSQGQN